MHPVRFGKTPSLSGHGYFGQFGVDSRNCSVESTRLRLRLSKQYSEQRCKSRNVFLAHKPETMMHLRRTCITIASMPNQPAFVKRAKCEERGHTMLASQIEVGAEERSAPLAVATHHLKSRGVHIRVRQSWNMLRPHGMSDCLLEVTSGASDAEWPQCHAKV